MSNESVPLAERNPPDDNKTKPTCVGCVLMLLSVAVIFGVALPIVRWRDPLTGDELPQEVAIIAPVLIGAAFHGIGTLLLRLLGLRIWTKSERDETPPPER